MVHNVIGGLYLTGDIFHTIAELCGAVKKSRCEQNVLGAVTRIR